MMCFLMARLLVTSTPEFTCSVNIRRKGTGLCIQMISVGIMIQQHKSYHCFRVVLYFLIFGVESPSKTTWCTEN